MKELINQATERGLTPLHFVLHIDTLNAIVSEVTGEKITTKPKKPVKFLGLPLYFDPDVDENEIILFAEDSTARIHQFTGVMTE